MEVLRSRDIQPKEEIKKRIDKFEQDKVIRVDDIQPMLRNRLNSPDQAWKYLIEKGLIDGKALERNYNGVDNAWIGEPCYIIGAGPPLRDFIDRVGWDFLDNKNTIGINHTIEEYDRFKWFFFLDKRFLDRTTYDIHKFKGIVFAQCTTGMQQSEKIKLFYCNSERPQQYFKDGLYSPNFSGLAALNLAIMTGANPIYLIGFGHGKNATADSYHYKKDYTGEVKQEKVFKKFTNVQKYFKQFRRYSNRIIHVTDGADLTAFKKKMTIEQFANSAAVKKRVEVSRSPKILHFSFSDDIKKHAEITQHIIKRGYGNHFLLDQKTQNIPQADLYILEHFLSTDKFVNSFPYPGKAINIVHTVNCIPRLPFIKNIALTNAWKKYLEHFFVKNIEVIPGGIDLKPFKNINPAAGAVLGRITRYSPAKIHPQFNDTIKKALDAVPGSTAIIYTQLDQASQRPPLLDPRVKYDKSCNISDFKGAYLKNLSVYLHMNGTFKDTLSFGIIEAMATGLPIVYLSEGTGVIEEVTGSAGIRCTNIAEVQAALIRLLKNKGEREKYFHLAKEQAKKYDAEKMIIEFNRVIKETLNAKI